MRTPAHRVALASALLLVLVSTLTGCTTGPTAGVDPGATTRPTTAAPPTPAEPVPDGPRAYPEPPANLTNESAKRVALAYEKAHLYNTLAADDFDDFGLSGYLSRDATVLRHADGGVYLRVRHPFWTTYEKTDEGTTARVHGDGQTIAIYYVSTEHVVRVRTDYGR